MRQQRERAARKSGPANSPRTAAPAGVPKARKRPYKEQRELDALPAAIETLEAEQAALHATLSDPALFKASPDRGRDATERLRRVADELEAAYARWNALESGDS